MQLVIEIPDEEYTWIIKSDETVFADVASKECMLHAIKNGVQLPKGHGRLKDIDAFINKVEADRQHAAYTRSWTADDILSALDKTYAPTVVEAEFPLTDTE